MDHLWYGMRVGTLEVGFLMRSEVELVCVDPKRIGEIWPHIEALLRTAIARTKISAFADIERGILCGDALLWLAASGEAGAIAVQAVASTSLQQTDVGKVCVITACAGRDMTRWLPLIAGIEDYARREGCRCVRIFGRKGWLRALDGYEERNIILDKDLSSWPP
jgi:hypothetical protein